MAKLIQLDEAAKLLGISPDDLTEMRSRNEIFGYRDGATWKFKQGELERVAQEKGITLGAAGSVEEADQESDDVTDFDLGEGLGSDSILVSDEELGQSDESTASTIIGEPDDLLPAESDLQLEQPGEGSSALRLAGDSKSELSDVELSIQSSDVLDSGDREPGPSDTANIDIGSSIGDDLSLASDSGSLELSLDELSEGGSELKLSDSQSAGNSGFGSAIDLELDDDDLVLGSGSGSDVNSVAADSGINLTNPSDSGLSLEEPAELSGSSGGEMLELGEDDMLEIEGVDDLEADLQSDDDFLLTPTDDGLDEESDSGSQVIALDSEEFDDSAAKMLADDDAPVLDAETVEFTDADAEDSAGFVAAAPVAAAAGEAEEAPYSVWNVLSLFFIVSILGFTGILMMDLMNNIWSWQGNYSFNSTIMDAILAMLPGSK